MKHIDDYCGYLRSENWLREIEERFGSYLEGLNRQEKLGIRAAITYWQFHQQVATNSPDIYNLLHAAFDTMGGLIDDESLAYGFCKIINDVPPADLEGLIECLSDNIFWIDCES